MPLFPFRKRTAEEWHRRLRDTKKPSELAEPLLSDQLFADKVKLLLAMPTSAKNNRLEMRELESILEDAGYTQLAQVARLVLFWANTVDELGPTLKWSQEIIEADTESRWIVQREIYLGEEARALEKATALCSDAQKSTELTQQLNKYQAELQDLDKRYWDQSRCYWRLEGDMPDGVISRAFKTCREGPDWYLSAWLRQDCAGRGGCCGRSCGCCEKPRETKRRWSRGHCTSACGCCVRSSPDIVDGTRNNMADFPFDVAACKTRYSQRVFRAYIWGLTFLDDMGLIGYYH